MNKTYICPHCGDELPPETVKKIIEEHLMEMRLKGSRTVTEKKAAAHKRNAERLNAAYTPEKRKIATQKRLATLAAKRAGK